MAKLGENAHFLTSIYDYSDEETIYISPDIYVFKMGDDYEIVQNEDGLPKLRINCEAQSHNY